MRGVCKEPSWHSIATVIYGSLSLHAVYRALDETDIPFAEDCLGDQFLIREGNIIKLLAATGEIQEFNYISCYEENSSHCNTLSTWTHTKVAIHTSIGKNYWRFKSISGPVISHYLVGFSFIVLNYSSRHLGEDATASQIAYSQRIATLLGVTSGLAKAIYGW